jgi:hypothetical protein
MIKIDPAFKAEWVAALRSGKYFQTLGRLVAVDNNDNVVGNCCLGVACELRKSEVVREGATYKPAGSQSKFGEDIYPPLGFSDLHLGQTQNPEVFIADLPENLQEEVLAIMRRVYGSANNIGSITLSFLNDSGADFALIADLIEVAL